MPRAVRALAWATIAAQVAFVACWILAGALQRDYSHVEQAISDLGAQFAQHAWVMNAGFVVVGLSVAALAPGLRRTLPACAAGAAAAALFAVAGAGMAVNAFLPLECSLSSEACRARLEAGALSWQTSAHVWAGSGVGLVQLATPFAIAAALWRRPSGLAAPTPVAVGALLAGLAGIGLAGATALALQVAGDDAFGLIQRLSLLCLHLWIGLVAAGILHTSRSKPIGDRASTRDLRGRASGLLRVLTGCLPARAPNRSNLGSRGTRSRIPYATEIPMASTLPTRVPVTEHLPAASADAAAHFEALLRFETDSWDVHEELATGQPTFVLLDVRGPDDYAAGHVPGARSLPRQDQRA